MKRYIALFTCVLIFFCFGLFTQARAQEGSEIARAYIKVKDNKGFGLVNGILRHNFGDNIFSIQAPKSMIENLKSNDSIEFRGYATQWQLLEVTDNLNNPLFHRSTQATCSPSTQIPWGVSKLNGGQSGSGSGIKVAVLDTGIKKDHPDLKNNIFACKDAQYANIRNRCADGNGHGTHVAGTIAANGKIFGVAPAASLIAIKVCSDGGLCWSDDISRGMRHAADLGANVISISIGGGSMTQDEENAVNYAVGKGSLIVAAAGNSGPSDNTILYPAAHPSVVAVGAIESTDAIASFSSRGNNYNTTPYNVEERDIELVGPGVNVESTWKNGCYLFASGTSMGTPHVSGLAAKLWQGNASSTRAFLQDRARNNYADLGRSGDDPDAGFGLPTAP